MLCVREPHLAQALLLLLGIIQEAFTDVLKHAAATRVSVVLDVRLDCWCRSWC